MFADFELMEDRSRPNALFFVYLARARDGSLVHLRLLRDLRVQDVLRNELVKARQLSHPGAARVLDFGEHAGRVYFAQPWYEGPTLRALMDDRTWSLGEAAAVLWPVLSALEAAHEIGLLHRDVAPENIFVTRDRVVLVDFGLALVQRLAGTPLSRASLSPEQAVGRAASTATDLFQAGLVLYELLTGRLPALGPVSEVTARIALGELDDARELGLTDAAAHALLDRALALDDARRFSSATEFLEALARAVPHPADLTGRLTAALHARPWPPPFAPH